MINDNIIFSDSNKAYKQITEYIDEMLFKGKVSYVHKTTKYNRWLDSKIMNLKESYGNSIRIFLLQNSEGDFDVEKLIEDSGIKLSKYLLGEILEESVGDKLLPPVDLNEFNSYLEEAKLNDTKGYKVLLTFLTLEVIKRRRTIPIAN